MAKVFISVLGTNNYVPCSYKHNDTIVVKETRFVQEATVSLCCKDWTESDRVLIFTTDEAEKKNWLDDGHSDQRAKEPIKRQGLKSILEGLKLEVPVTNVKIPEGKTEKEIWEIFQAIFDNLHEADEIVFDITHAFRSIPMLVMVVLSYAKVIKSVTLTGIYYGAFEVLGNPRDVPEMPLEERVAPIFDLTPFDRLLDWTVAIDRFVSAGDASMVSRLGATSSIVGRDRRGKPGSTGVSADRIAGMMDAFSRSISTCRGRSVSGAASKLKHHLAKEKASSDKHDPALAPLIRYVQAKLAGFRGEEVTDGVAAVRWCLAHNLIQQGFTILQETLVSYLILQIGEKKTSSPTTRKIATASIGLFKRGSPETSWTGEAAKNPEKTRRFFQLFESREDIKDFFTGRPFDTLKKFRDDINHGGYTGNTHRAEEFRETLSQMLTTVEKFL